ncbi:FecR family protein [Winogradskyella litorisediminis]|uniref:FecR family protein n=1 Tax=Winogradskyella litorisediminis TaxID=1156618 RepID=A0ABW3NAG4_9FLAO
MEREELIKKWLDHNLNTEEQNAFEALEDYEVLTKLSRATEGYKAPSYNSEEEFIELKTKLKTQKKSSVLKPLLRIAAVLLIGFSVFYFTSNQETEFSTKIAQTEIITLPDESNVVLNAASSLSFNKKTWEDEREVSLYGEAYFKVSKGSKFEVVTSAGKVAVLGTEFNVKQRENYFEVTCFEGLVAVTHKTKTLKLKPGERFVFSDTNTNLEKELLTKPSWLDEESSFNSTKLKYVLAELKRQYKIKIDSKAIDTNQNFTGSFTHKNLDLALKSITLPLGISYTKRNNVIVFKGE